MMRFHYVTRQLRDNLRASALTPLVSLVALAFCFFLVGLCGIALLRQDALIPDWLASDRVVAYLKSDVSQEDGDRIVGEVGSWPEVQEVRLVSRQQAYEQLKGQFAHWKGVLEGLQDDFLPVSVKITLKGEAVRSGGAEEVAAKLRQWPQVDEILYGKAQGEWLQSLAGQWVNVWLFLAALLILMAVLVVSNAIRLIFICRKPEVEIYSLVGTRQLVVNLPYYVEGVLLGGAGALLAMVPLTLAAAQIERLLPGFWGAALALSGRESLLLAVGVLACGAASGWLGSRIAVDKPL